MIRSRVSLHVICQSLCLVKDMSNKLLRDRIIHFPDVGAIYNHVLQMQHRVLILQLARLQFSYIIQMYIFEACLCVVFMFVARGYS